MNRTNENSSRSDLDQNNESNENPMTKIETQRKSQWGKILKMTLPEVRKLAYKNDAVIRIYKNYFEKAQEVGRSSLPEEERRKLLTVQEEEFKKLIQVISDSGVPEEEDLSEKDELLVLRADQSQLKFQLSKKDELINDLTKELNSKRTVQFSESRQSTRNVED